MNDQIIYDFSIKGPRIVDFSKILQYDYFPLAPTLQILLMQAKNGHTLVRLSLMQLVLQRAFATLLAHSSLQLMPK